MSVTQTLKRMTETQRHGTEGASIENESRIVMTNREYWDATWGGGGDQSLGSIRNKFGYEAEHPYLVRRRRARALS